MCIGTTPDFEPYGREQTLMPCAGRICNYSPKTLRPARVRTAQSLPRNLHPRIAETDYIPRYERFL